MGIEEYIHGKVSVVKNEKTGKPDLTTEQAKLATRAIGRTSVENENTNRGDKRSAEMNVQAQMREGLGSVDATISKPTKEEIAIQTENILNMVTEYKSISKNVLQPMLDKYLAEKDGRMKELLGSEFARVKGEILIDIENNLENIADNKIPEMMNAKLDLMAVKDAIIDIEEQQLKLAA